VVCWYQYAGRSCFSSSIVCGLPSRFASMSCIEHRLLHRCYYLRYRVPYCTMGPRARADRVGLVTLGVLTVGVN
jgi:hypothetical protein